MKHLKKFNESNSGLDQEVQDFCETHLAYLIDEGLEVECYQFEESSKEIIYVTLKYKFDSTRDYDYNFPCWDDIKDNMIPFFTHLSNKYDLLKKGGKEVWIDYVTIGNSHDGTHGLIFNSGSNFKFSLNDIIKDNTDVLAKLNANFRILNIRCNVMKKIESKKLKKLNSWADTIDKRIEKLFKRK